jgi:hypothetical protein
MARNRSDWEQQQVGRAAGEHGIKWNTWQIDYRFGQLRRWDRYWHRSRSASSKWKWAEHSLRDFLTTPDTCSKPAQHWRTDRDPQEIPNTTYQ